MVSVIIPFHRGIHFLEDCLNSLREQTRKSFEVVLVYDDVTEDVESLVSGYRDVLTIREYTSPKHGVAPARNYGMKKAEGDYFYFMDADDYIFPDVIERFDDAVKENPVEFASGSCIATWFNRTVFFGIENSGQPDNGNAKGSHSLYRPRYAEDIDASALPEKERSACHYERNLCGMMVMRKGLKEVSALHVLVRRDFVEEHGIVFDEETTLYADILFVTRVLYYGENSLFLSECNYVQRRHNDPEHFPAISQMTDEERFDQMLDAFMRASKGIDMDSLAGLCLADKMMNYYTYFFITKLRRGTEDYWRNERFERMSQVIASLPKSYTSKLHGYKRRTMKAVVRGDLKKSMRLVNRHLALEKAGKIIGNKNIFNRYLYSNYFLKRPMKENYVMFETFMGKSYSDSPKYIYEYLAKTYPGKYTFIWSLANPRGVRLPYGGKKVKRFGIRYMYYLAVSKYMVFNVRQPGWFVKREGNIFLETWHGTPLKRLVFDQEEVTSASPLHKHQFYIQSRLWDYLVSPNDFSTGAFQSAFLFEKEKIVPCGYPRNDILYTDNTPERIGALKKQFGIPEGKKVVLYAPTWRDDEYYDKGKYKFTLKLDLHKMREKLGEEFVVILRTHYYIADNLDVSGMEGFVYNESHYDDISELYLISDILITDYSSVFFDFGNLRRPMLFFTYDLEKYRDMLRGFYLDIEKDLPGPLLYTSDEVIDALQHIDDIQKRYEKRYEEFYDRFCHIDDGHASERICEFVFNGKDFR